MEQDETKNENINDEILVVVLVVVVAAGE